MGLMMGSTPIYAKIITSLLVLTLFGFALSPRRFGNFYFLFRPLVQPFAYLQYRLIGAIPLTGIFSVMIVIYTCLITFFSRERTFFVKNSIYLYFMLFLFLLSSFSSIDYFSTISWILKFSTGVMMFVIMYNNITNEDDFMTLVKSLIYCSIVPMAFGYYQFMTGTGHAWIGQYYDGKRIDSFLGEYNAYGEFLSLIICANIIGLAKETVRHKRLFFILAMLSLIISLILSLNRGSWISLVLGLVISSAFYFRHIKLKWLVIGLASVSLAGCPIIVKRFQELHVKTEYGYSKNTFEGRVTNWQTIWDMVCERPVLGYGAGTLFSNVMEKRLGKAASSPHNDYLLLWFECGIFTPIAYAAFLLSNAFYFLTRRNNLQTINFALAAACLYFMMIAFFQNIIMNATVFPMFLALVSAGLKLNSLVNFPENARGKLPVPSFS